MQPIVDYIDKVISNIDNESLISEVKKEVNKMMNKFPLFAY
jgi:glycine hydroxymethyltransferase